jgi:heavy metal translocating P-type ATPase
MALLTDESKRNILILFLSLVSVATSFFFGERVVVNPAWVAIALCGIPIVKNAAEGLIKRFDVTADVLVAIALIASIAIGEIFAAAEVAFIMAIGSYLEERTVRKARAGIERLVRLAPSEARVVMGEEELMVPAEDVKVGNVIRVLAGEIIPVDGEIVYGKTSVDQSVMTGESLPVDKEEGDEVASGTVNQFGAFDMKALKVGEDSSIQRMARLVESADADKAQIVRQADRWAVWIVVAALTSALAAFLFTGEAIRAVTILVVFCPCALVLATPAAIMAGIGNLAGHGVLVRQGDALERIAKVKTVAFDKTGTLTYGKPSATCIFPYKEGLLEDELLQVAASAELRSEHPLGKAIVEAARRKGIEIPSPDSFDLRPGLGVLATVGGKLATAGSEKLLRKQGIAVPDALADKAQAAIETGSTVIYIAIGEDAAGFISLSDTLRLDSSKAVAKLHSMGLKTLLLTGDAPHSANHVGKLACVQEIRSSLLPEDKLNEIYEHQSRGELVLMVGDGINDAPALKAAHAGIAMGGIGSGIAVDAADAVLAGDELKELPHLVSLSGRVMRTIAINIAASLTLNFIAVFLAMAGAMGPVPGALVHNLGSVAVVLNSSLLLKWRDKRFGG